MGGPRRSLTITHDGREKTNSLRVKAGLLSPRVTTAEKEEEGGKKKKHPGKGKRLKRKKKTTRSGEKSYVAEGVSVVVCDEDPITVVDEEVDLSHLVRFIDETLTLKQTVLFFQAFRTVLPNFSVIMEDIIRTKITDSVQESMSACSTRVDRKTQRTYVAYELDSPMETTLQEDYPELWKRNVSNCTLFPDVVPGGLRNDITTRRYAWFERDSELVIATANIRQAVIKSYIASVHVASDPNAPPISRDHMYQLEN